MRLLALLAGPSPSPAPTAVEVSATLGSPGLLGFVVTFAVAVALVLLARSMAAHLRRAARGPADQDPPDAGDADTPDRTDRP
ncbi:MAG: hypothetical protein KJ548_02695 [Actinobacteria bacterium]|nr:hypothetical protein [Actinomycetota bacterium]MBU4335457.1 hypothetical protein [Actinomycetota bacterium]